MKPKQKASKTHAGRPANSRTVKMKERLRRDCVSVSKLPSCCIFNKPRKQLDGCLDHIHNTLIKETRTILPESMTTIIDPKILHNLEQRIKEISPSTPGGLVYIALSLTASLNLNVKLKQPHGIIFDACIILPRGPPLVLSVIRDGTRNTEAISRYNLHLTKALIQAVRQFTNENFSALYGALTPNDFTTRKMFKKAYTRIEESSSFFCIPESISMSDQKYLGITKAFFAVAASTDVVHTLCSDGDTTDEDEIQLWFLTKEQFAVLSENIDRSLVTVSAGPDTGATVLMLEVASRLEKSDKTLLVSPREDVCKIVRRRKLCSHVMTKDKFDSSMSSRTTLPSRVKHVVCEGRWAPKDVKVGHVWCFVRNPEEADSVHVGNPADTEPSSKPDELNQRTVAQRLCSAMETPPCSPDY